MELAKASIEPEGGEKIKVLFNPNQYSLDKGNQIAEIAVPGLDAPILQYVRGNSRTLTMELFFDTYEEQSDVRTYTKKIYNLLSIDREKHVPPICKFVWGDFQFPCVLERVGGKFTLFLPDGTPVRATLSVVFKEFLKVEDLVRVSPTQSADHTKLRTVRWGDSLSSIAAAEYNDPGQWRPIALANRIENPLELDPGRVLVIPALV